MAEYIIQDSTLKGIADAIREKEGSAESIQADDFADRIKALAGRSDDDLPFGDGDIPYYINREGSNETTIKPRMKALLQEAYEDVVDILNECDLDMIAPNNVDSSLYMFNNQVAIYDGLYISFPSTGSDGIFQETFEILFESANYLIERLKMLLGSHIFIRIGDSVHKVPVNGAQEDIEKFLLNTAGYETIDQSGYGTGLFKAGEKIFITSQIDVDRFFLLVIYII